MDVIARAADGFHHPTSEDQLVLLVKHAHDAGLKLRVRGSGHSVRGAVLGDDSDIHVMLDGYRGLTWLREEADHAIVEVQAGTNLGRDPYDPTKTSTWANSLDAQLQARGYALDDLGGISHQTVSGFLMTGSSGGSLTHSIDENIVGIRFIDGTGKIHDVSRDDVGEAGDLFDAIGVSMGLLGVISTVRLRVTRSYNLFGKQVTSSTDACTIDLFGDGTTTKPSLANYLRQAGYSRLMWWPQNDFERIQVWQASRMQPQPDFVPQPYLELGRAARLASLAGSVLYTIIGNLDDLSKVPAKLADWKRHLEGDLTGEPDDNACVHPDAAGVATRYQAADVIEFLRTRMVQGLARHPHLRDVRSASHERSNGLIDAAKDAIEWVEDQVGEGIEHSVGWVIAKLIELILDGALDSPLAQKLANWFHKELPYWIDEILAIFVNDGSEIFWDSWMCGLPMDNQMDDQLWPTDFTELWIDVDKTAEVMSAMRDWYAGGGDPEVAYDRTGAFSCELYAATKSRFWMSPSYGCDVFRVDVFWFGHNADDPRSDFYPQFWRLLRPFGFRPHWGKFLPDPASGDWPAYYRAQLPRMADFLALRTKLDPKDVFLTNYWKDNLGIS